MFVLIQVNGTLAPLEVEPLRYLFCCLLHSVQYFLKIHLACNVKRMFICHTYLLSIAKGSRDQACLQAGIRGVEGEIILSSLGYFPEPRNPRPFGRFLFSSVPVCMPDRTVPP